MFSGVLKEAMPFLKEDKMGDRVKRVQRVITIWKEREIFDEKFLDDLNSLLDDSKEEHIVDNFQVSPEGCQINRRKVDMLLLTFSRSNCAPS